jgi:hypothetical protein
MLPPFFGQKVKRANLLFDNFPELKQAVDEINCFRNWYKPKTSENELFENERTLGNWIDKVENSETNEMKNFRNLVVNHEQRILNYHRYGNKRNCRKCKCEDKRSNQKK